MWQGEEMAWDGRKWSVIRNKYYLHFTSMKGTTNIQGGKLVFIMKPVYIVVYCSDMDN